jgi:hypothetical protein
MAKVDKKKVDEYAKARDSYGLNTKEGARIQNQINIMLGSSKRRDTSNLPTAKQMKIAESGKKQVLAENKASNKAAKVNTKNVTSGGTDIASILSGSLNTKSSKDYEKERTTKHKKTLKQMLGGM